ncbi:MAG: Ig-like domain-containing protein, partial [Propionibacteriaceae bacterium]|jgi:adhesin/invasin|nr:Ig-like domain-containing protein [Propionibacteriaceae bacterium]
VTVKSTKAGDFAIHAKLGGTEISGSPKTITFVPGPPVFGTGYTELLLTKSGGQAVADNSDFWTGTLTVRDQYKNVIPNVAVTWPTSISGNADTANAATVFDAQATTNTSGKATAKVKSGNPDTYTLIAQVDSTAVTGTPDALFTTGAPTAVNSTLEATTGTRFANNEQTHTLTATVRDANDLPVSGVVLTWEGLDATGLTATGQNAASDADGKITVTVKSTQAGIFPIHATLSGTDISGSPKSIQFVPPPVVIGPPSAANSDLVALTSGNKRADGVEYHRLRLTIRDAADYPVAGASADFTYSTDLNVTLSSDVSDANGEITLTITTTKAGSYPVQAALGGTQVNGSPKTVRFVAGPANATHSQLTLTKTDAAAAKVLANGVDSYTATVIVRDAYDNPVQGATIDFSSTATVAAASGTSNASGQVATTVTSTAAGTFPVHAKLAGADVANSPRNAVFSAGEAVAGHSELVKLTSGDKVADGVDAHQVKVIVRDGFDNPVAGVSVAWGYSTVTGTPSAAVTDANGEITLTITSTRSGSYPISASVGGEQVRNSPVTVSFVAGEASAETSVIEITPPILDVSQTATVKVTLMDAFGNLLGHGGDDVALEKITGSGLLAAGDVTLGALTDNGDGTYTASIGSSKAGTARVGFTVNGDEGANTAQVVFTFDSDADPDTSAFSVSKTSATADGVDYITGSAVVRNAASQPIANAQVVFSVPANLKGGSANGPASVTAVTNGSGVAEIRYTTTVAAQYQVGANVAAGAISGSPKTITFTAGAPDPGRSEIAIAPNPQAVGQASTITVTLRDAFGNLASATGATIELALVTGTDRLSATEAAIGTSAGYANGVKAPINATKRGTAEVSYTLNGTAGGSTATVRFTKAPDAPVIEVANATEISGTAEPGSTITITLPNGSSPAKVEVTTGADGHWTANTPDGAVSGDFTVVASNPDGSSPPVTGSLDAIRPDPPVIEKAEPDEIAGTGEPGAIVVIELPDGTKITEDIDDGGNWVVRPDTPIEPGTVITVTVVDPAGNESDPVQVVVGALSVPATIYVTTNQNTPVTVDVLARATGPVEIYLHSYGDAGSGTVSYNAAASGFEVLPANAKGTLTYTPGTDYVGADQFTVTLVDARGIKATTTVSVDVLEVEQPDYNTGGVLVPGGNAGLILLLAMGVTLAAVAARRKAE